MDAHQLCAVSARSARSRSGSGADFALARSIQDVKPWQLADVEQARRYVFRDITLAEGYRSLMAVPIPSPDLIRGIT